jgi:hypothetical protein
MRTLSLFLLFALAGCGGSDDAPGPGGVTREEARGLDEAAAATDINTVVVENATEEPAK